MIQVLVLLFDTTRGIVAGNDPIYYDTTDAQTTADIS